MGRRFVKQPNGLYAEFSSTVDHFTTWNMTREEAVEYVVEEAKREAVRQAEAALQQADFECPRLMHCTGPVGEPGTRWRESLPTIEEVHGKAKREAFEREYEQVAEEENKK